MGPRFVPIEEWRGYGWSGLPYQYHPAEGIALHHAVINPIGSIEERMQLVDRIHQASLGGFAYTDGACDTSVAGGRGPFVGAHTLNYNQRVKAYVFLTNGVEYSLSYPEIEAFRFWRQQWVAEGWVAEDHYVMPHGWFPGNSTACCGPLIIDQLHELLMPYQGYYDGAIPAPPAADLDEETPMFTIVCPEHGDGRVWMTNLSARYWIKNPDEWVRLAQLHVIPWVVDAAGNTWPRETFPVSAVVMDKIIDVENTQGAYPISWDLQRMLTNPGPGYDAFVAAVAAGSGGGGSGPGGGASPAEVEAKIVEVLGRTSVKRADLVVGPDA